MEKTKYLVIGTVLFSKKAGVEITLISQNKIDKKIKVRFDSNKLNFLYSAEFSEKDLKFIIDRDDYCGATMEIKK